MSFQVRASDSSPVSNSPVGGVGSGFSSGVGTSVHPYPNRSPNMKGTSPLAAPTTPVPAPYVSPSLGSGSQSSRLPPPFSLGPPMSADMDYASTNQQQQQPSSQQQQQLPSGAGRGGTDPTKYKTTICRNWEQTGTCQFRGCTFAHGVDDLRPPARPNNNHVLSTVPQSALHALLSATTTTTTTTTSSPEPSAYQTSPTMKATTISPGLGIGATGPTNGTPPTPPTATGLGLMGTLRIEQIAELLVTEVHRQRDLVTVHTEANRTLENMLRREQELKDESSARLATLEKEIARLKEENVQKDKEVAALAVVAEQQGKKTIEAFMASYNVATKPKTTPPSSSEGSTSQGFPTPGASAVVGPSTSAVGAAKKEPLSSPNTSGVGSSSGTGAGGSGSGAGGVGRIGSGSGTSTGTPTVGSPTSSDDHLMAILSSLNIGQQHQTP